MAETGSSHPDPNSRPAPAAMLSGEDGFQDDEASISALDAVHDLSDIELARLGLSRGVLALRMG